MSSTHIGRSKWRKSIYQPHNPGKYKGSKFPVVRSEWERRFARFLDFNASVLEWTSEEPAIPYMNPNTGTQWNYYPDFLIKIKTQTGIEVQLIEIKPKKQTFQPITEGKRQKTIIHEALTWRMNTAKWAAARSYCESRGWKFKILTEDNLFG
jgi:hypothetical protein